MLNAKERSLLSFIKRKCGENGSCIISKKDLSDILRDIKIGASTKNLGASTNALRDIEAAGYTENVLCKKNGEDVFLITLTKKGKNFDRERVLDKRDLIFKFTIAVLSAVVTFIFGRFLVYIFR